MTKLQWNIIEAKAIDSDNSQTFIIPRLPMIPLDSNMPFKYKRSISLWGWHFAWQSTSPKNKLPKTICLMLSKPVFSLGQLYVALSRVRLFQFVTAPKMLKKLHSLEKQKGTFYQQFSCWWKWLINYYANTKFNFAGNLSSFTIACRASEVIWMATA